MPSRECFAPPFCRQAKNPSDLLPWEAFNHKIYSLHRMQTEARSTAVSSCVCKVAGMLADTPSSSQRAEETCQLTASTTGGESLKPRFVCQAKQQRSSKLLSLQSRVRQSSLIRNHDSGPYGQSCTNRCYSSPLDLLPIPGWCHGGMSSQSGSVDAASVRGARLLSAHGEGSHVYLRVGCWHGCFLPMEGGHLYLHGRQGRQPTMGEGRRHGQCRNPSKWFSDPRNRTQKQKRTEKNKKVNTRGRA